MRHVTDGDLHAYLDGALDQLPDDRGSEVREHLSVCPVCRERLQDEEGLRSRAGEILGHPPLEALALPSFEDLRERAAAPEAGGDPHEGSALEEARTRYRGPIRGIPLAWAATVVLALGVGWMGGEVWRTLPQAPTLPQEGGAGVVNLTAPGAGAGGAQESSVAERAVPTGEPLPGEPREERLQEVPPEARGGEARGADARSGDLPAGAGRGDVIEVQGSRALRAESPAELLERGRMPAPSLAPQTLQATGDLPAREAEMRWPPADAMDEVRPLESSLAVPGLKVISVEWEEWLPGERALHVRQLLSVGDTLELRYLGLLMGMEPHEEARAAMKALVPEGTVDRPLSPAVLEASLPPGWSQVEMRWGRGWLVARAPLPEASIKALLRSLR